MRVRILGAAAGGGLPQWNCRCPNCASVREGSGPLLPRTQSSVAVSADGRWWFLLNVSPDVRQQILAFPPLGPPEGQGRGSGIAGCLLTDGELDHTAGLLLLREGAPFRIFCTPLVRRWLNRYLPIEPMLARFANPSWHDLGLNAALDLPLPDGTSSGLRVTAFEVDRHLPRFVTELPAEAEGSVIGLSIADERTGGKLVYAPCVASISPTLQEESRRAEAVLMDGTFWSQDEPVAMGIGQRSALEMGHLPVSDGSLGWLGGLPARHRVYVHINNTNPMLDPRGGEYQKVREKGIQVGADGDEFPL
jgi:pyrroloquinoline quinone biosynthesis protein B